MKVLLINNYYSGCYCETGGLIAGENQTVIECENIPDEPNYLKSLAYKWTGSSWEFIQSKYDELLNEEKAEQEKIRSENPSIESLQSKVEYLSMMTGVPLDV